MILLKRGCAYTKPHYSKKSDGTGDLLPQNWATEKYSVSGFLSFQNRFVDGIDEFLTRRSPNTALCEDEDDHICIWIH